MQRIVLFLLLLTPCIATADLAIGFRASGGGDGTLLGAEAQYRHGLGYVSAEAHAGPGDTGILAAGAGVALGSHYTLTTGVTAETYNDDWQNYGDHINAGYKIAAGVRQDNFEFSVGFHRLGHTLEYITTSTGKSLRQYKLDGSVSSTTQKLIHHRQISQNLTFIQITVHF